MEHNLDMVIIRSRRFLKNVIEMYDCNACEVLEKQVYIMDMDGKSQSKSKADLLSNLQ